MGYDQVTFSGAGRVSRHNSSRDNDDNDRWNEFCDRLDDLVAEFEDIGLWGGGIRIEGYPDYRELTTH